MATAFVLDGFDECADDREMLAIINRLCRVSPCKVIIFARPNVRFLKSFISQNSGRLLLLEHTADAANLNDIKQYVRPNINELLDSEVIACNYTGEELVENLSIRSNHMFLWAKLMISYLNSPALTPAKRLEAIDRRNLFEGLNAMYSAILQTLQNHFLEVPERQMIQKVLQCISGASQPLLTSELCMALAILPGVPTSSSAHIVNF